MIYGIKQIEKQFPGFEAQFTGGQLFDVREIFNKYQDDLKFTDGIKQQCEDIFTNYWDIIRPPAEKMYFIVGLNCGSDGNVTEKLYTEYACIVGRIGNELVIHDLVAHEQFFKYQRGFALHIGKMFIYNTTNPLGTHYSVASPVFNDNKHWVKYYLGSTNKDSYLTKLSDHLKDLIYEQSNAFVYSIVLSLFYLNIKNIKQNTAYVSQQRGFYYPKAWGREYKVLSLSQTLTEHSPGPDLPPGYHVRGHFQRGHWKRKKTGVYWWNPHWRGDFSKGMVMKDYKAKAE